MAHDHHHEHHASAHDHDDDHHHDHNGSHADGHDKHAGHSVAMFRDRFWITLALSIPTIIYSEMIQHWFGYTAPQFPGSAYVGATFGTIVFFYGGWVFLQGAWRELADRLPGMMTLISLAISVAFIYSTLVTFDLIRGMDLWWELATLVAIMLLGHWIEMSSISQAHGALKELAKLLPDTALRITDGDDTEEVPVDQLSDGDILLIKPGASIPADGEVVKGQSKVNEAMVTGESSPVEKNKGDAVIAGTTNGQGSLRIKVTKTGDETALAGIMRMVEQAQSSKSRAQALADRAAFLLTIIAIGSAIITAVVWILIGREWDFTIQRIVTVLVIACPHALGLAIPLVIAISTTLGAKHGLLVRDRRGLEEARLLDVIVFDKTGTLTLGEHRVVNMTTVDDIEDDDALRLAAAVERDAEHPVAQALLASAQDKDLDVPDATEFESIPGHGVQATVDGRTLHVGGPALLKKLDVEPNEALRNAAEDAASNGQSAIYLIDDDTAVAVFAIADAVREESADAIKRLHEAGLEVAMLTGDAQAVADAVAKELNIDTVFAEVLPEDKAEKIESLQKEGKRVAMVGDGVNDAPALATADVGIAIGAGTDVAVEAGDIVLVRSDPRDIATIIALSRATYRKMIQNLWWAAGYNIAAIPLAAGVLAAWGFLMHPALGAVLMSLSTIIVAINAQFLRRASLD